MENGTTHLLDFLAEKALGAGASVSWMEKNELKWLEIDREGEEVPDLLLQISSSDVNSFVTQIKELRSTGNLIIPVLRVQEEEELRLLLRNCGFREVEIYRLSSTERNQYYSQQMEEKR